MHERLKEEFYEARQPGFSTARPKTNANIQKLEETATWTRMTDSKKKIQDKWCQYFKVSHHMVTTEGAIRAYERRMNLRETSITMHRALCISN